MPIYIPVDELEAGGEETLVTGSGAAVIITCGVDAPFTYV